MGNWRNVSGEDRLVGYGLPIATTIAADAVLSVTDDADAAYADQPAIWQAVAPASPVVDSSTPTTDPTPADQPAAS